MKRVGIHEVREVRESPPRVLALEIEWNNELNPDDGSREVMPGQFVQLGLEIEDEVVVRHYSVSSPYVDETFEITVEVDPGGELTPRLAKLEPDDTVLVDGPFGRTYYENESEILVLASGPGVGPAVGIGERAVAEGNEAEVIYLSSDGHQDVPHQTRLVELDAQIVGEDEFPSAVTDYLSEKSTQVSDDDQVSDDEDDELRIFVYGFSEFVEMTLEILDSSSPELEENKKVERFD